MKQCEGRLEVRVAEVRVEGSQVDCANERFVNQCARTERSDVEIIEVVRGGTLFGLSSRSHEAALEFIGVHVGAAHDDDVEDVRAAALGFFAEGVLVDGYLAPVGEHETMRGQRRRQESPGACGGLFLPRQKHRSSGHAVLRRWSEPEDRSRDFRHDAGAVAGAAVRIDRSSMAET